MRAQGPYRPKKGRKTSPLGALVEGLRIGAGVDLGDAGSLAPEECRVIVALLKKQAEAVAKWSS